MAKKKPKFEIEESEEEETTPAPLMTEAAEPTGEPDSGENVNEEPAAKKAKVSEPEPAAGSFHYIVKGSPGRKVPVGHRFFYDNNGKKTEAETLNEGFYNNVGEFRAIARNTNNVTW